MDDRTKAKAKLELDFPWQIDAAGIERLILDGIRDQNPIIAAGATITVDVHEPVPVVPGVPVAYRRRAAL